MEYDDLIAGRVKNRKRECTKTNKVLVELTNDLNDEDPYQGESDEKDPDYKTDIEDDDIIPSYLFKITKPNKSVTKTPGRRGRGGRGRRGGRSYQGVNENEEPIWIKKEEKIPRPPNAFMMFANQWRKHMSGFYVGDSNKKVSVRLGLHWRILNEKVKQFYYQLAQDEEEKHKTKYPNYIYNPKEARARKAYRDAAKNQNRLPATQTSQQQQFLAPSPSYHHQSTPNMSQSVTPYQPMPTRPSQGPSQSFAGSQHQDYPFMPFNNYGNVNTPVPGPSQSHSHYTAPMNSYFGSMEISEPNTWNPVQQNNITQFPNRPFTDYSYDQMNQGNSEPVNSGEFINETYNGYHYRKPTPTLNILTPRALNNSVMSESPSVLPKSTENSSPDEHIDHFTGRNSKGLLPYKSSPINNKEMKVYENTPCTTPVLPSCHQMATQYHQKSSPKQHGEDSCRMSPYSRPRTPKSAVEIRPEINQQYNNKLTASTKSLQDTRISPKTAEPARRGPKPGSRQGRKSPSTSCPRRSWKRQGITPPEPPPPLPAPPPMPGPPPAEVHPLPGFKQAFGGTERGRLIATPEITTECDSVSANTDESHTDLHFLNLDLFSAEDKFQYEQNLNPVYTECI